MGTSRWVSACAYVHKRSYTGAYFVYSSDLVICQHVQRVLYTNRGSTQYVLRLGSPRTRGQTDAYTV